MHTSYKLLIRAPGTLDMQTDMRQHMSKKVTFSEDEDLAESHVHRTLKSVSVIISSTRPFLDMQVVHACTLLHSKR